MRVLLAHPGTQHAFRLARELDARGLLGEFWTGMAFAENSLLARVSGFVRGWPAVGGLNSRVAPAINASLLHTVPRNEIRALWHLRRGADPVSVLHDRNASFQRAIPDRALAENDVVIGFDTSGWILADRARRMGRPFVLDRSIAHPAWIEQCLAEIGRRYPEWLPHPSTRPPAVADAESAEHELAQRIVVGSSFARQTLVDAGISAARICVNPYGVDWTRFAGPNPIVESVNRPLRFLFVGSVIGRKGVPILLDAWRRVPGGAAELWLVGHCGSRERALIPPLSGLRIVGQVAHADIPAIYAAGDVLVLPSLVEGFSLVLLEALAAGLAIIATPNAGADDLLDDPTLGCVVAAGSVDALESALRRYIDRPPGRRQVSVAANRLVSRYSWSAYGDRWESILRELR